MEQSSTPSKFRFRDHGKFQISMHSDPSSDDISSVSSDPNSVPDIESMTGRGIKHLCSELLELKAAASENLQKDIFANYSAFIRILEEVSGVENELVQLEKHFVTHKRLVKELIDGIYPKVLSEETMSSIFEYHIDDVPSTPSELEVHINNVSEKLDILLSENRIDEALDLLELAYEYYRRIEFEGYSPDSEMMFYDSLISEKKFKLIQQLTQIAENPKIARSELQKALAGLCRLGDSQLAVRLLLKHYHSRIQTETYNLQWSKSSSNVIYMRELAKFVFSMISQAASSFRILCGETSPHASELMVWACEETKSLVTGLDKFIKSISEVRGGLSTAIKAVQFAVSYCSLLENQNLVLRPYLIRHLYPYMEEVFLHLHVNRLRKVIAIFSASDPWILERYLVSRVFDGGSSSLAVEKPPEYCLLTKSGRKFLTVSQAIIEDISPLVALQMGGLVISGFMNLFTEYSVILERALTFETSVTEEASSRIKLAESLPQQVSVLANLSTLVQFLSIMVKSIFRGTSFTDSQLENLSVVSQQKELDDFLLFIEDGSNKLRYKFCQKFILKVLSTYSSHELTPAIHNNEPCDANTIRDLIPSSVFQIFFLELRKLEQLAEEKVFEVDWLMGLLRELMESIVVWVPKNRETRATTIENTSSEPDDPKQFLLDVQFLVEIGMYGGYFSSDPLLLLTLIKSVFHSAGLDPFRDGNNDGWAIDVATKTIQKLLDIENQTVCNGNFSQKDDISSSEKEIDAEEAVIEKDDAEAVSLNIEFSPQERSMDLLELKKGYVDKNTPNLRQTSIQLEDTDSINAADAESDKLKITDKYSIWLLTSVKGVIENSEEIKSKLNEVPH